jgi:hypothetical protein
MGNDIFIAGKDNAEKNPEKALKGGAWAQLYERGTLFGCYDFLERFIGIRFYFPGEIGTVTPKHDKLELPAINITENPDYITRRYSWLWKAGADPYGKDGLKSYTFKNLNYYRLKMETRYIPVCHGLARLGYLRRFANSHPEYFALMGNGKRHNNPKYSHPGQLCLSSRIKEEIYQDAKAFLTGNSAESRNVTTIYGKHRWSPASFRKGYFDIMPPDGFYKCQCPKCKEHFSKGPQATSEFIWDFFCDIAERLKKEKITGNLTTMAYSPYKEVPERDIPNNILVMLATPGPWIFHLSKFYTKEEKILKSWAKKLNGKIWIWTYANKYGTRNLPNIPTVTPKCIGKYYPLQKNYIIGAYMMSTTDFFIYNYLNYYIFSKVSWDNSVDVEKILKEHYQKMFGPAAIPMENIYNHFEKNWLRICGNPIETPLGPSNFTASTYEIWEKIYSVDEIKLIDDLFNTSENLTLNSPEHNERVKFMRKHLFVPLKKERKLYTKNQKGIAALNFHLKEIPSYSTITIDGKINENVWAKSNEIFLLPLNKKDEKSNIKTSVRAIKDKENLYVSFVCNEPEMDKVVSYERHFDDKEIWKDSSVEIFLNPKSDRKIYYHIIVNSSGSLSDEIGKKIGSREDRNWDWNSNAKVEVLCNKESWIVEMKIPLVSFDKLNNKGVPVNFTRHRKQQGKLSELFTWSPFIKKSFHEIENFGSIKFNSGNKNNLIKNSNFKAFVKGNRFGGWGAPMRKTLKCGQSWAIVSDTFIEGGKSLMLNCSKQSTIYAVQALPELKPNTEYLLSYFVKTKNILHSVDKCSGVCVNIWSDHNHFFPSNFNFYTGTIPWCEQGFKFKTGLNTNKKSKSFIKFWIMKASGTAWIDKVKLEEIKK